MMQFSLNSVEYDIEASIKIPATWACRVRSQAILA